MNDNFPCNLPPDMPDFCPPPEKPHHHHHSMPPVPSVVEGQSLYEAVNNLSDRVNVCIKTYNEVMEHNYQTLHNLERAAEANGAYYNPCEVYTEPGYYADESATYTLIHKKTVDRHNQPIRIKLKLAYGNTTNSAVEQSIMNASKVHFADKIVIAQPIPDNKEGWYGRVIYNGAPLPSNDKPNLYTAGFTRAGVLRVYSNAVSTEQMLRDTIEDAMGVSGVLVQNGQVCDDSYLENIPMWNSQVARVAIGQNTNTREVIFLVCGNENDVNKKGMTSKAVANVLRSYGCDIAVELSEGVKCMAMDKGQLMFTPEDNKIPNGYAFWVISRENCFYNDYQRELAALMQNFGENLWLEYLTQKDLDATKARLEAEVGRLEGLISDEEKARQDADKALQDNIDKEATTRQEEDEKLQKNIDAEAATRQQADETLQTNIDNEQSRAEAAEEALGGRIDTEAQERQDADSELEGKIQQEQKRAEEAEEAIRQSVTALTDRVTRIETNVTQLQTNVANMQNDISVMQSNIITMQNTITEQQITLGNFQNDLNDFKLKLAEMGRQLDALDPEKLARQVADLFASDVVPLPIPAATTTKLGGIIVTEDFSVTLDGQLTVNAIDEDEITAKWEE